MEGETPEVVEKYGAKVIGIYPMAGERAVVARIAFPTRNFPAYLPMIMSTVAGNVLGQDGIRLVDIDFPESVLKELPGPMMGIDGIRKLLNVYNRPLVGAILKPWHRRHAGCQRRRRTEGRYGRSRRHQG